MTATAPAADPLAHRKREITRFIFAASDMRQATEATRALIYERFNGDLCRALETAIATCYARPFTTSRGVGQLERNGKWAPPKNTREWYLHDFLIGWRHRLYAHTDATVAREVFDASAVVGGTHRYVEAWIPIARGELPGIEALSIMQEARFSEEAQRLQEAIRATS